MSTSNYLDFIQILSSGTALIGLSIAWFSFSKQLNERTKLKKEDHRFALAAISTELENIRPWIKDYPLRDKTFWLQNPEARHWKLPLAQIPYSFKHSHITETAHSGAAKGFSENLTGALLEFEQASNAFEHGLELLKTSAYANLKVSWSLTQKFLHTEKARLTEDEWALMCQTFELNRFLYVNCIGSSKVDSSSDQNNNDQSIPTARETQSNLNLNRAYHQLKAAVKKEQLLAESRLVIWFNRLLHVTAAILIALGASMVVHAFVAYPDSLSETVHIGVSSHEK